MSVLIRLYWLLLAGSAAAPAWRAFHHEFSAVDVKATGIGLTALGVYFLFRAIQGERA